jgi:hypothetical protein
MSEELYLISKAERDLDEIFKGSDNPHAAAAGHFLALAPGAAIGGAITAPKGKKGRAALGSGVGSAAGMTPGMMLANRAARARKPGLALGGQLLGMAGGMGGASGGYRLAVGPKPLKKKTAAS